MIAAYLFGGVALLVFLGVSILVTGRNLKSLVVTDSKYSEVNEQGQTVEVKQRELSASKLQALVWILVTMFAYASVFGAFLLNSESGDPLPDLPGIPVNLLALMGLSVATAAGAKGVTVSYKDQGRIDKKSGAATTDAEGNPQLVKVQMLVWTFLGALWYLLKVIKFIDGIETLPEGAYALPDVDGALLVLMGVAQGAYIGDKLVSRDIHKTPKLERIMPLQGAVGTKVTLIGENFGDDQGSNFVSIGDKIIESTEEGLVSWSSLKIEAKIPADCEPGQVMVKVYRDGEWSEECPFTVSDTGADADGP
jgi:hypothetical protein